MGKNNLLGQLLVIIGNCCSSTSRIGWILEHSVGKETPNFHHNALGILRDCFVNTSSFTSVSSGICLSTFTYVLIVRAEHTASTCLTNLEYVHDVLWTTLASG